MQRRVDGKSMTRLSSYLIAVCLVLAITASSAKAVGRDSGNQSEIGITAVAVNNVLGTIQTETRTIKVSDGVFEREIIETDSNSSTQFLFLDETILTIGPESRLVLDEMVYNSNASKGKVIITAAKGLFTFVSGSLVSESYLIRTPTSTIGVRGTKFDLFVSRNGSSTVILRSGAVDVKNLTGSIRRITTAGLATSVVTQNSDPTLPAPPAPELEQLLKPLSNPGELLDKSPEQVDATREGVEKESDKQRQRALKREEKKEKKDAKREKREKKKAAKREQGQEKKVAKREKREEKKVAKREKKAAQKATKKAAKAARKSTKKASKDAKKVAKQASKEAKKVAKQASKEARKASKSAKKQARKAAKEAKKATREMRRICREMKRLARRRAKIALN